MRRTLLVIGLSAVVASATALPSVAAGTTNVQSPFPDSRVNSSTPVVVNVNEDGCGGAFEAPATSSVEARLSANGFDTYPGSRTASLQRDGTCSDTTTWRGVSIDPAAPSAFFDASAPMCNGRWRLQARADGGSWGTGAPFTVSRAPAAPSGVQVSVTDDRVKVSWSANPETDLVGYRVERRPSGGSSWSNLATATATSFTDSDVDPGQWEYRVVALRGDGAGAAPCADDQPDLETASAARTASVDDPDPEPTPSEDDGSTGGSTDGGSTDTGGATGGDGGGTDGDTGGTSTDGSDGTGDGSDPGAGDTTGGSDGDTTGGSDGDTTGGSGGDGTTGTTGSPRRVGAPPPAVRTGPDLSSPDLPAVAQPEAPEERYYGEDDEYSDELDFGEAGGVERTESGTRTRTTLRTRVVPQAVQEFVSRFVDPDRVLKPIAAGLVLVAFALHLRRWSREHDAA